MKTPDKSDDPNPLPDNVPDCHQLIGELRSKTKSLEERVADLEKQVGRRNRMLFGKRSAKTSSTVLTGTGKAIYQSNDQELDAEKGNLQIVEDEGKHGGGGRSAPDNAPTERQIEHCITDPSELACPDCGAARKVIGFRVSHQLDVLKALFQTLKHIQYSYACPKCNGGVVTARKPEQPFGKGYATGALVSHIGTAKFCWHQPTYRQEQMCQAQGVPIARSSMCRLLKDGADILGHIVRGMHKRILESRFIQSDSTSMPVIKKGLGKTHRGTVWIFRGDENHPFNIYEFTETGEGKHPERMLAGYKGFLLTDGAAVFNGAIQNGATAANCWAHAYRYFEDARDSEQELSDYAMAIIKGLFDIERLGAQLTEQERYDLRQRLAKPRLGKLKLWLDWQSERVDFLAKSKFGEAVNYCLNRWESLCTYADHAFLLADNNHSENALRPAVLGRNYAKLANMAS